MENEAITDFCIQEDIDCNKSIGILFLDSKLDENNFNLPKAFLYDSHTQLLQNILKFLKRIRYQVYHFLIVNRLLMVVKHSTSLDRKE